MKSGAFTAVPCRDTTWRGGGGLFGSSSTVQSDERPFSSAGFDFWLELSSTPFLIELIIIPLS